MVISSFTKGWINCFNIHIYLLLILFYLEYLYPILILFYVTYLSPALMLKFL